MAPAFVSPIPFRTLANPPRRCRSRSAPHLPFMTASHPPSQPAQLPSPSLSPSAPSAPSPIVTLTFFETNTFTLSTSTTTLLIDPWLTGDLVYISPHFFRGRKPPAGVAAISSLDVTTVDAIVLTQGLPDHAHPPTLEKLPKHIPVVAPRSAVSLLRSLGFETVLEAHYGDVVRPVPSRPDVKLTAARGSVVGPPWSDAQLAYVFEFGTGRETSSVYHEPHGNHEQRVLREYRGKLDAVIAPVVKTTIPPLGNYALVNGVPQAIQLCEGVLPRTCVTFDNSGGEQTGFLPRFLKKTGGREEFGNRVKEIDALKDMRIITATAGEPVVIAGIGAADDDPRSS